MDPQEKKMLEETYVLAEKNNKILKSIYRSMQWARVARTVYWIIVIGVAVGAYYYTQPYLDQLIKIGISIKDNADNISKIFGSFKGQ